jgi:hypothetical protein
MKLLTNSLIIISAAVLVYCSYFLYKELTSRVEKTGGDVIGTIVFKKKNASRKYTDSVIWEEIAQESEIYNYDAIRTMEYSSAVLTLKDGTRIELDQNTMLVVIMKDKTLNINFDQGGVTAQNNAGGEGSITLNSKDASISLAKGDVSVNSDEKGMDIRVNSGAAVVAAGGKELAVSSDESATLKNGIAESSKDSFVPLFPGRNSYIIAFGKTRPVNFSWKSLIEGEVSVEIALNKRFQPLLKSFKTRKTGSTVDLPAGDYYWRITKGKMMSYPVKFTILSDKKPELTSPYINQNITLTEGSEIIPFRWEKSQYAVNYEITAARDKNMTDVVFKRTSKVNTISTDTLQQAGTYYWSVRSIYSPGIISDSTITGPSSFNVDKRQFALSRPEPLDPGQVTSEKPFILNWKGVQGAKSYKIEIASDADFSMGKITKESANTFIKISDKPPIGKYYWRVNAVKGDKTSEWSELALFSITKAVQISAIYPSPGAVLYDKPETINFSWSDPNRGEKYLFELSERNDFRFIKESGETSSSGIKIKSPGLGIHFWRVKLKDDSGKVIAQSQPAEFTIPQDMKIPVLISPKDNAKMTPGFRKRLRLEWEKIPGVSQYEVEIFQRIAGIDRTLTIYTAKKNFIEISNQMFSKPGQFSWLVKAKKITGGRVTAFRESKKSFFEIEGMELLPAPKIKTPGVLFNVK